MKPVVASVIDRDRRECRNGMFQILSLVTAPPSVVPVSAAYFFPFFGRALAGATFSSTRNQR